MSRAARVALVTLGATVALVAVLASERWLADVVSRVHEAGAVGVLAYAALYLAATLVFVPGTLLTLGAGLAYGPFWGTLLVSPVSVLAATLAFSLGRTLARGWVERRLRGDKRLAAIDRAVGQDGLRLVLLLRLSPVVPFNLLNYALGLTRVPLRDYVVASAVGMLPGTVLYVYLGSLATTAREPSMGPWAGVLYWGGLVATLLVTVLATRIARQGLHEVLDDEHPASSSDIQRSLHAEEPRDVDSPAIC